MAVLYRFLYRFLILDISVQNLYGTYGTVRTVRTVRF